MGYPSYTFYQLCCHPLSFIYYVLAVRNLTNDGDAICDTINRSSVTGNFSPTGCASYFSANYPLVNLVGHSLFTEGTLQLVLVEVLPITLTEMHVTSRCFNHWPENVQSSSMVLPQRPLQNISVCTLHCFWFYQLIYFGNIPWLVCIQPFILYLHIVQWSFFNMHKVILEYCIFIMTFYLFTHPSIDGNQQSSSIMY